MVIGLTEAGKNDHGGHCRSLTLCVCAFIFVPMHMCEAVHIPKWQVGR